ncbi:MAG: DEAD/DEAH box helicase, partial [Kosmotoga sp.]
MERRVKINLTNINKIKKFKTIIHKLTMDEKLDENEKSYILSCAILFLKHYNSDKRFKSYRDFAYYIILKYSLRYDDYQPLYDFSVNFGFYPIARDIVEKDLLIDLNINNYLLDLSIDKYENPKKNYIETYEQKEKKKFLLNDNSPELSYIAPTSFGKSSIIVNYIEKYNKLSMKIGVIVPTKSLLMQTYKMIRDSEPNTRIIIHDEMYHEDETYIAVFTQERALRLIEKNDTYFDVLFIDEAHNIFEKNSRSILISRLIKKNMKLNPKHKVIYLSPLIMDSNNLKLYPEQKITEQRIHFNIKEAEIFEYRLNNKIYKYNRFVNEFYFLEKENNMISYIKENSKHKNFIYIRSPQKIEKFAKVLSEQVINLDEKEEIKELLDILSQNVHEKFYVIKLIKKGVIYLHGKLPDLIKEYLESKYQKLVNINFLIANTVILEGMNLPIDTLFILNTYSLYGKELTNLIGRVNRLNEVFMPDENKLHKLLPQIHFINNEEYYRKNSNMTKKIKSLRNRIFDDDVKNPVLETFDFDSLNDEEKEKYKSIKDKEDFINQSSDKELDLLKKYFIEEGIDLVYLDIDNVLSTIYKRINQIKGGLANKWEDKRVLDKIYNLFIKGLDNEIKNFEFSRLSNEKARNFYE